MPIIIGIVMIIRILMPLLILALTSLRSFLAKLSAICGAIEEVMAMARAPMTSVIFGTHEEMRDEMC